MADSGLRYSDWHHSRMHRFRREGRALPPSVLRFHVSPVFGLDSGFTDREFGGDAQLNSRRVLLGLFYWEAFSHV